MHLGNKTVQLNSMSNVYAHHYFHKADVQWVNAQGCSTRMATVYTF